jgi:hypothetical protein
MRVLQGILNENLEYFSQLQNDILKRLSNLPMGSIKKRIINGKDYYYLQKRNRKKIEHKYIGKIIPALLAKEIKKRVELRKELKTVKEALKTLKKTQKRKCA